MGSKTNSSVAYDSDSETLAALQTVENTVVLLRTQRRRLDEDKFPTLSGGWTGNNFVSNWISASLSSGLGCHHDM